jgi:hypothetical protein
MMSVLKFGFVIVALVLSAACAQTATVTAVVHKAAAPSASTAATAAPTPAPASTPAPAVQPVQPAPAPPPAQPASSTCALTGAGGGSVRVTSANGLTTIAVSAMGLTPGAHATHVHRGCDGSTAAHLFYLSSVFGPSGSSSTTLRITRPSPGWTVIIYPGPTAAGRPVLCAAIA